MNDDQLLRAQVDGTAAETGLALFRIFAARATAELVRLKAEAEVQAREEKQKKGLEISYSYRL